MANIRIKNLPAAPTPNPGDIIPIDGANTRGTTIAQMVETGRPFATQAEAQEGTNTTKTMNPLTTKQAIAAQWTIALTAIGVTFPNNTLRADARDYLDVAPLVANRAALKALDTTKEQAAYLTSNGRYGWFVWLTGDFSAAIAADTQEGIYIKADAFAATVGAWVRVNTSGSLHVGWFGAQSTNSTTANSTAVNGALAVCRYANTRFMDVAGTISVNDDILNTTGVFFTGSGKVVVGSSGKPISMNQVDYGKAVVGQQNLISWYSLLAGALNVSNIVLVGDSNTEGGGWLSLASSYPDKILKNYARNKGFAPQIYNLGVGGTGIASLDTTAFWMADTTVGLIIIAYGTNNATGGIANYENVLDAKLTTIRATRGFNLGIILKSPATGTDTYAPDGTPHLRDEIWSRQVHEVHLRMVEKHNVCAVDTFSQFWYVRGSYGGVVMDTLSDYDPVNYRTDAHIHLRDTLNFHVWGGVLGPVVFPDEISLTSKNNLNRWYTTFDTDYVPLAAWVPSFFSYGRNVFPVTTANGWPVNGMAVNDRGETNSRQEVWGDGVGFVRSGLSAFGSWFTKGVSPVTATLGTGVTVGPGTTTVAKSGRMIVADGYWNISGNIVVDQVLMTFAAGDRPARGNVVSVMTGAGSIPGLVTASDGTLKAKMAITAPGYFSFTPFPYA